MQVDISSNDIYLLLLLLQMMFIKVPSISTHTGSQTSTPLIHCHTDDVVIQVAPLFYPRLFSAVVSTKLETRMAGNWTFVWKFS